MDGPGAATILLPLNTIIGRRIELGQIAGLLTAGGVRLLTLTGPGGVGKTRLALQAAAGLRNSFGDGVFFVPLASITNPGLILPTIAQTLGVREASGGPLLSSLTAALGDKHLLLLLDNFEQVVEGASHVADLLLRAPNLHVLATSRIALGVYGEQEFPVEPLALPEAGMQPSREQATQYEAVRLFIERARSARPDFQVSNATAPTLAEICRRLDGLPLAIELAAARIKALTPDALLKRLSRRLPMLTGGAANLPPRHRTLRGAIAWSYDLLSDDEKRLFRALSVFAGGCTLEGAFSLWTSLSPSSDEQSCLDLLTALVNKSLLKQEEQESGEPRFLMLETIREFARERLDESGEAAQIESEHAAYFVALTEEAEPKLVGAEQATWLDRLERDHDNLRAVLQRAHDARDGATGLRLGGALWRFWYMRGYITEGRKWLSGALEAGEGTDALALARALNGLGNLSDIQGEYDEAREAHEKALLLWQEAGEKRGVARSLNNLGNVVRLQGNYARAQDLYRRSLELYRELGSEWESAILLHNLSVATWSLGEVEDAQRLGEEGLQKQRKLGDKRGTASVLDSLGAILASRGDYEGARARHEEALNLWREVADRPGIARSMCALGDVLASQGDHVTARRMQSESLRTRYKLGNKRGIADCLHRLATVDRERSEPRRLVTLVSAADALCASIGSAVPDEEQARLDHWLAFARDKMGAEAYGEAWEEGKRLQLDAAVALALGDDPAATEARARMEDALEVDSPQSVQLTARELEVLRLVAAGLTNPAIAEHLSLSINTIQTHMRSIFSKINVNTRGAAVRYAFEHGLG
jgi:predicted ATPase/DNA-binding CsgD family transcriptional regulator